jgi:YhcH/YjgK/YiaL family protein
MIFDRFENASLYPLGPAWQRAVDFLQTLTPDSEEKKYPIDGDDLFAIVMSYDTALPETGVFESHRDYVDIQSVLTGAEGFECAFADTLEVATPYDAAKDAAFYVRTTPGHSRVEVVPGTFILLYPNDAHLAGLTVGGESQRVKKVVIKVRCELLCSTAP